MSYLTMDEALTANLFHDIRHNKLRRNGVTKTWKRQPERFRVPVKYGLYGYSYITDRDYCHIAEGCNEQPVSRHSKQNSYTVANG